MAEVKLNNSDAYRFLSIKAVPILAKAVEEYGMKYVKPSATSKSSTSKVTDVIFKFKDFGGNLISTSPTTYYPGSSSVAISLHKMMYGKNILFVKDSKIHVVSTGKLLGVWANEEICKVDKRSYMDGLGEKSQLSRVDVAWMTDNADYTIPMSEDLFNEYTKYLSDIC